jgi:hypothetical protein
VLDEQASTLPRRAILTGTLLGVAVETHAQVTPTARRRP